MMFHIAANFLGSLLKAGERINYQVRHLISSRNRMSGDERLNSSNYGLNKICGVRSNGFSRFPAEAVTTNLTGSGTTAVAVCEIVAE